MAAPSNASTKQYSAGNKVLNVTTQDPTLQAGYEAPVGNAMTNTDQTSLAEAGKFLGNAIRGNKKYDLNTVYEQFRADNAGKAVTTQQINDFIQSNGLKFQDYQKLDSKWRTSAQKDAIQNPNGGGSPGAKGGMGGNDCYGGTCHPGGDIRVNPTWTKRLGGVKRVPGGQIVPIEGTNAVEFKGRSHKDGGIIIEKDVNGNPTVEVEKNEVMLPLKMKDGKKQDYIFSDYLKIGGKSFAQRSKEMLKGAASQANLQQLATMQEKMAGRNSETVSVAKYGGIPQYATGGVPTNECPPGTIYNAATGNCEPFSFNSVANMVTGKTPINVPNNTTDPATNSKPAVPIVISNPGKRYSQTEKDAGWKYIYDIAKSLGDPYPEISASQWALESGWGSSNTGTFNPFGQTASKGESATKLNTPRDPGGGTKRFKNYSSYEEAIQDHINRWAPKYQNAKDPLEAVYMLQNHGGAPRYAEGHNNDWEGYVKKIITLSDTRSKTFGVHRESSYVPDKTKYPKAKGVNINTADSTPVKETPKKLPPPPVSGDVVPPTFAQRNSLPGVASMQMNEEIQMPEQPKSNITFDPTNTKEERLEKEKSAASTITDPIKENKRPDGIYLTYNKDTKTYTYRDGKGLEIVSGKNLNRLSNQMNALQPGASGFDTQLAEMEAPVQRQDLTGVKPDFAAVTPTNGQTATNNQTVIAQQNGTANAPADATVNPGVQAPNRQAPVTQADNTVAPDGTRLPAGYVWDATLGAPVSTTALNQAGTNSSKTPNTGNPPTINNQNSTFQYTAQTPGYLDYNDPNTAGGIFSGDRYDKEWRPLVGSTMADAAKADQVINYLLNYTGTDAEDVKAKLKGKNRAEQIAAINNLATDTKVGPFHNAVYGAMQQVNSGGGNVATNNPPVVPPVVPPSTTSGTTTTTKRYTACPPGTYLSTDGTCKQNPTYSKPYDGNIVAAIGAGAQLIPPIYAALNPYQKVGAIPGAPSVRGALLGRENYNPERRNVGDMYTAVNQEVTNNNTGAAGFAIRQAANVTAGKQMLDIANAESKVNTELRGKEAVLGQDASKFNAENSMKGQMFNADLAQRQNQYVDERNVGVVDAAANRLAGMANTYNQYKATDHLARVTNANTHSLERDKMYESLLKDAQNKNSQFNGATDAELRRIAAGLVEEQMGGVGRTGGVRQYISRLGELKSARATKAKL
jgi:flagellum-specific peptidoglycan hydrolase FlgJ